MQWLEYTTNANATRQVNVFTDLGAGANGGPGVDHGAFINECADVDVGRHQHHIFSDERAATGGGRWHHAEAAFAELGFGPAFEFGIDFVEVAEFAAFLDAVVVSAERQQYGLLDPLMGHPFAVDFFGNAQGATVQLVNDLINGFFGLFRRTGWRQVVAVFPEVFDNRLQRVIDGVAHRHVLVSIRVSW